MLAGWFVTPAVMAIREALRSAHAQGRVAVIGHARLAAALAGARAGLDVVPVGVSARAARTLPGCVGALDELEPASLAAVIGVELGEDAAWEQTLRAWVGAVRDGGAIVMVDRGKPAEASRRALCGGLTELEQRHVGRTIVTSGLVTHL